MWRTTRPTPDVRTIILIEDSVRFYSAYLPLLYTELVKQTLGLMREGINLSQKLLRLRARPKVLFATSFEEAWAFYRDYKEYTLGAIVDARFPWNGELRGRRRRGVHPPHQGRRSRTPGRTPVLGAAKRTPGRGHRRRLHPEGLPPAAGQPAQVPAPQLRLRRFRLPPPGTEPRSAARTTPGPWCGKWPGCRAIPSNTTPPTTTSPTGSGPGPSSFWPTWSNR